MTDKWYIIQTRPRWEKKIADCLEQKGIESYCPVKKVKRQWSDRMKTLEEPLFKSCVLVKIAPEQKTDVRLLEGVINFVYENGKPAQIKNKQVEMLKKGLSFEAYEMINGHENGEKETGRGRKAFETYLDDFNQWLKICMERPKLA
jgi:transcription antitermination factor NusG